MFFLCFRALRTQQDGYVHATKLYYYYYYYLYPQRLRGHTNRTNVHTPCGKVPYVKNIARQNFNRSSNFGYNWTSFHRKKKNLKMPTPEATRARTRGQFHRAAKQRKLLTRNICLADFLGYQPNLHVKLLMYFGW